MIGQDLRVVSGGGGHDGWEDLYLTEYASTVRIVGLLLGDFAAGEDVVQDAMARLLVVWGRVDDPRAYLRRTAINLSRSRLRRAVVARRHRAEVDLVVAGPDGDVDGWAARSVLVRELQRLPGRQREAIVLRFYAQLTEAEMAAAMKISVGSVKTHLHRAIEALRPRIEELR